MKIFTAIFPLILCLTFSTVAQEKQTVAPKIDETLLRVETQDGKYYELRSSDFAKLPRREVKSKTHEAAETTFSGVDLREVLKLAGVKFGDEGKKANLISYLIVEAADNYRVVFAMAEFEPNFTDKTILLADQRDGKPLSKDEGKLRLVVPDEKKLARAVRQVVIIRIKTIDSKISSNYDSDKSVDEDSIREAVFRKILNSCSDNGKILKAYYLAIDGASDPNDALLKKFTGCRIPIKKSSESFMSEADGSIILDNETKEQGILVSISKITWTSSNEVKLYAGTHIGNMGGDGCVYVLRKENANWKIISQDQCVVS